MSQFCIVYVTSKPTHIGRKVSEEVVMEYPRDTCEHCSVNAVAAYDAVHDGAVAVKVSCEPADAAFLAVEFVFDALSNTYHAFSFMLRLLCYQALLATENNEGVRFLSEA